MKSCHQAIRFVDVFDYFCTSDKIIVFLLWWYIMIEEIINVHGETIFMLQ